MRAGKAGVETVPSGRDEPALDDVGDTRAHVMPPARRLRDLRGRDRWLAGALLGLLLVPFVVALVRAFHDGWVPSGDEANIATRALDVFSRHPPLTGLPSTSALYGDKISTNHPGPFEFYLMAVPLRVFGMSAGPLLTAAAINAAFVLIAAWVFFRRLGLTAMLWAGVLLLAVMASGGTAVLTDTLSSNMTMYSILATAVLAWALIDGDLPLLPPAVLVASYAAQQHLSAGLIVFVLVSVAMPALAIQVVRAARRGDAAIGKVARRWSLAATGIAAVCWAPVIDDQLRGHPGNLGAIVRFARDNTRQKLGFKLGLYQALHAVTPPTVLGRTDSSGLDLLSSPGAFRIGLGVVIVGALVLLAWKRAQSPGLSRLAFLALVLIGAGILNGSNVPRSIEETRINLYRWTWTVALVTFAALGLGVAALINWSARGSPVVRRVRPFGRLALLVVAALLATSVVLVSGHDDHNRELPAFALEQRIDSAVLARIDRTRPVLIAANGSDATLSVAPHLIFRLIEAGVRVEVSPFWTSTYGQNRTYRPRSRPQSIVVTSGQAESPSGAGELLAIEPFGPARSAEYDRLAVERGALLDELSRAAAGVKVELAPGASAFIGREFSGLTLYRIEVEFSNLPVDPRMALRDPRFLELVLRGSLRTPVLSRSKVQQLLDLPGYRYRGTNQDEQVEVRLVEPK